MLWPPEVMEVGELGMYLAQFLAAALKASRCGISGLALLMRWISSLMKRLYADGSLCFFSGGLTTKGGEGDGGWSLEVEEEEEEELPFL